MSPCRNSIIFSVGRNIRRLSKSLTFQYDKVVYLIEPNEENTRLVHEHVKVLDYPYGDVSIVYGHRKLEFKTFDKLGHAQQTQIVNDKRLDQVLKFAHQQQEEFELQQKRTRSKNVPKRKAQQRALQEQLRAINPVLVTPETFKSSKSLYLDHKGTFLFGRKKTFKNEIDNGCTSPIVMSSLTYLHLIHKHRTVPLVDVVI